MKTAVNDTTAMVIANKSVPLKMNKYLFESARLGFRNWRDADIPKMIEISSDPEVMEFFPALATPEQTTAFVQKMKLMFSEKGYCYFAVDRLEDGRFIGFIGFFYQTYESEFTPCIDIGWRLHKDYWSRGYATEGAKKCLEYGLKELALTEVISTAPAINLKSIRVMEKIGMKKRLDFRHPRLANHERLVDCVCFEIKKAIQS